MILSNPDYSLSLTMHVRVTSYISASKLFLRRILQALNYHFSLYPEFSRFLLKKQPGATIIQIFKYGAIQRYMNSGIPT